MRLHHNYAVTIAKGRFTHNFSELGPLNLLIGK
jgi:hypothetical protein